MKAYNSTEKFFGGYRMPISPDTWGPVVWDALHYVSLGYPETNPSVNVKQAAFEFLSSLPFLLPCSTCRDHLAQTYENELPLTPSIFESKQAFGTYIVMLRDLIKSKHACPSCNASRHVFPEDVESRLLLGASKNEHDKYAWYMSTAVFILALSLFLFFLHRVTSKAKNGNLR